MEKRRGIGCTTSCIARVRVPSDGNVRSVPLALLAAAWPSLVYSLYCCAFQNTKLANFLSTSQTAAFPTHVLTCGPAVDYLSFPRGKRNMTVSYPHCTATLPREPELVAPAQAQETHLDLLSSITV